MTAFYGSVALKERCIAQLQEHYRLDQITQGTYGIWYEEDPDLFRGCHLGCLGHPQHGESPHEKVERLWGFPFKLTCLIESIFENLPFADAREFPLQQVQDTPVGADLSELSERFYWLWAATYPDVRMHQSHAVAARDLFLALLRNAPRPVAKTRRKHVGQ